MGLGDGCRLLYCDGSGVVRVGMHGQSIPVFDASRLLSGTSVYDSRRTLSTGRGGLVGRNRVTAGRYYKLVTRGGGANAQTGKGPE